jgi:hypothetical protein
MRDPAACLVIYPCMIQPARVSYIIHPNCPDQLIHAWSNSQVVFRIRSDPLLLGLPDSETFIKSVSGSFLLWNIVLPGLIFALWSPAVFTCLYENFSLVMWYFKKLFLLTIAGRRVGSGSEDPDRQKSPGFGTLLPGQKNYTWSLLPSRHQQIFRLAVSGRQSIWTLEDFFL